MAAWSRTVPSTHSAYNVADSHRGRSPSRLRKVGTLAVADRAHEDALVLHHPVLLESDEAVAAVAEALEKLHAHAECLREKA